MKSAIQKGQLTTWKDDRGFGFIKPNDGGKEVFLHISALKETGRRPKIGDTILYSEVTESGNKIRAARASIQGVLPRSTTKKKKDNLAKTIIGSLILIVTAVFAVEFSPSRSPSPVTSVTKPGCVIKGNISIETGNYLYHLPGMEDYESTVIDQSKGERWFCSESEAIANGWRKAPR